MIARDATPVAHTPPLRRVDLSARPAGDPNAHPVVDMAYSPAECDRIWGLVRQTATGTNPPVVTTPPDDPVFFRAYRGGKLIRRDELEIGPDEPAHVDTSGWDAA